MSRPMWVVLTTLLVVASACSADGLGAGPVDGGPGSTTTTTTTATTSTASASTSVETAALPVREVAFRIEPDQAAPGQSITISGTGCPPDLAWTADSSVEYFVVVGAGVPGGVRPPHVNAPITEPGHVSFNLLPEYRDAQIAQAVPDPDGDWRATWTVPNPFDGTHALISALCIGGTGIEDGNVHYGAIQLTVHS